MKLLYEKLIDDKHFKHDYVESSKLLLKYSLEECCK